MNSKPNSLETVAGQPSWRLASRDVEAWVTKLGGHLGPVVFDRRRRKIRPYSVAPWVEEKTRSELPALLQVLRGDFFCMPFGGNAVPYRGEKHPPHGETANASWQFQALEEEGDQVTLRLSLQTRVRPGQVLKEITLVDRQNVVYCRHTVSGMEGPMNFGHHAMLKFPEAAGSGLISTSPVLCAQVFPGEFETAQNYGYSSLKPGAEFRTLRTVPLAVGGNTDLSQYPARRGYEDLVMLTADLDEPLAWTAVSFPKERYVWFALKNPRILRHTIFWISNGGRHYAPWSGRHTAVMGLEDVTSYFHLGLAESAQKNPLSAKGISTCHQFNPGEALAIPYIMGVVPVPAGFGRVRSIDPVFGGEEITLTSREGRHVSARVNLDFLGTL